MRFMGPVNLADKGVSAVSLLYTAKSAIDRIYSIPWGGGESWLSLGFGSGSSLDEG